MAHEVASRWNTKDMSLGRCDIKRWLVNVPLVCTPAVQPIRIVYIHAKVGFEPLLKHWYTVWSHEIYAI